MTRRDKVVEHFWLDMLGRPEFWVVIVALPYMVLIVLLWPASLLHGRLEALVEGLADQIDRRM
jgi:hypothetical protein